MFLDKIAYYLRHTFVILLQTTLHFCSQNAPLMCYPCVMLTSYLVMSNTSLVRTLVPSTCYHPSNCLTRSWEWHESALKYFRPEHVWDRNCSTKTDLSLQGYATPSATPAEVCQWFFVHTTRVSKPQCFPVIWHIASVIPSSYLRHTIANNIVFPQPESSVALLILRHTVVIPLWCRRLRLLRRLCLRHTILELLSDEKLGMVWVCT